MKNIHVLPTSQPSSIWINYVVKRLIYGQFTSNDTKINCQNQNIYITSDEYIGLSWYLDGDLVRKGVIDDEDYWSVRKDYKKIVMTSDQDLIKDGVQAINDEFLEWFVKNTSCEEVEIRKIEDELISPKNPKIRFNALQDPPSFISAESLNNMILTYKYEIIIPKEESKQTDWKESTKALMEAYGDNPKDFPYEEPKQETLEEFAERLCPNKQVEYDMIIEGAKWQQEQDENKYSEEDLDAFRKFMIQEQNFSKSCLDVFIEQFKKK